MTRILAALAAVTLAFAAQAQDAQRELIPVAGDVHLLRNNFHLSLVVPTAEGTVRVDPIEAGAGDWLNAELEARGLPAVSHLIYSHSHLDHASGGAAHPGAVTVAHEDAPAEIDGVAIDMRVGDSHVLELGGKTFELTNLGGGHDNHMLAVVVRPEDVAFIVDVAAPKRLPFRNFGGADVDDWMDQIRAAQALDFAVFAPGHGSVGVKADLDGALAYMQALKAGVKAGLDAGRSVDEIKAGLTLDDYADWGSYEQWRELNIEGMADFLRRTGQAG